MKILVTGGAGFIGSHSTEYLIETGHFPLILDNLSTGDLNNLAHLPANKYEVKVGDVNDTSILSEAAIGCDAILHLAAIVSIPQSLAEPLETFNVNTNGTAQVLEVARLNGVRRVVLASTCAVYGDLPGRKAETSPTFPLAPYSTSKLMAEELCQIYAQCYGLEVVRLRYFNVYGIRQPANSPYSGVIAKWTHNLQSGLPCTIYGDGNQTRDFVSVKDVARANALALTLPFDRFNTADGSPLLNVATGSSVSLNQIFSHLEQICGHPIPRIDEPFRTGDIMHSSANSDRLQQLGWQPQVSLLEGLAELLAVDRQQ